MAPTTSTDVDQRNIVLVTADSLRADHCGFINPERELTPTLDELAEAGVAFETAITPGPRTPSSMPVIWTGHHVGHENQGVYGSRSEKGASWRERQQRIRNHTRRFPTIAERLRARGYDTGAVTTNPWTSAETGFDQGFRRFEAVNGLPTDSSTPLLKRILAQGSKLPQVPDTERWLLTWTDIYDTILDLTETLTEPYFLWIFLLDPHQPYLTPTAYRSETRGHEMYYANVRYNQHYSPFEQLPSHLDAWLNASYRDTVRSVDGFVEQLLTDLDGDDPAFVFHADHGEALLEHGTRGHRPELYEENLRVPLLAHNVGRTGRISEQVTLRELPAFLCSLARGEPDVDQLRAEWAIAATEECERIAVRTDDWKRIRSSETWNFAHDSPSDELYDLRTDAAETQNRFESRPEVVDRLDQWLEAHQQAQTERELIGEASRTVAQTQT